ncbi:hypothetical protein U2F10_36275 [Leptothoe sp. EHU-05/26/07-4]
MKMRFKDVKSGFGLIGVNAAATLVFIFLLNALSNVVLLIYKMAEYRAIINQERDMAALPNYEDNSEFSEIHFQEFAHLPVQYEPFIGWSRLPFQGRTITVDVEGNRLHPNTQTSPKGLPSKAVHFFGGSTMWGTGASDYETIPAFFNEDTGIPSFNLGETGFNARQSLAQLIQLLTVSDKDINSVVFYDGVNEVLSLCRSEHDVGEHIRAHRMREVLNDQVNAIPLSEFQYYLDFMFLRGSRSLVFGIAQAQSDKQPWNCDTQPQKARQVAKSLLRTWELAHSITEKEGIRFLAVLQPVAFLGNPKLDHISHLQDDDNPLGKQFRAVYPLIQELIRERQYDWIVDYTNLFSMDEYIYVDFCHVAANGNKIVAQQVSKDLDIVWRAN